MLNIFIKTLFLVLSVISPVLSFSTELKKAEVVSDGDRGLALEWVYEVVGYIETMTADEDGYIYLLGYTKENNQKDYFVTKYTSHGDIVWKKTFYTEDHNDVFYYVNKIVCRNGRVYFKICTLDRNIYFEQEKIRSTSGDDAYLFLELSAQDGELLNVETFDFISDKLYFDIAGNNDKFWIGVISDGDYIGYGNTKPYNKFSGLNQSGLKTETRTNGKTDYYIAKLDSDNNLVWDFSLGGDGPEYGESYGQLSYSINGDTMFVFLCYMSDSIDIDPNPNNEVMIYGKKVIIQKDKLGAVLIQYNISGAKPELMSFKEYDWSWYINKSYLYSHPNKGTYMAVENPDYRIEIDGDIYKKSGEFHIYATVDDQCNINVVDSIPPSGDLTSFSHISYLYDDKNNFYITNSRVLHSRVDTLPIVLRFTKDGKEYVYNELETWYTCVSKFDENGTYYWSLLLRNLQSREFICSSEGFVGFLYGKFTTNGGTFVTDLDPNPDKEYISTKKNNIFSLYRETYRITSEPSEHGEVIVPDTFAWHGKDYELEVISEKGYQLTSLTANGKEIMPDSDGRYYLRNVTEPICVDAQFVENSSVDDVNSQKSKISVYPNPVDDELTIKSDIAPTQMKIYDVAGRQIMMVTDGTTKIDVSSLSAGMYVLKMKVNGVEMQSEFVKK